MKTCLIALLVLFLLPVAVWADGIKKVDQPQGIPSFLGYVPDRLIVVVKPEVGELNVQITATARAAVHIGEPQFDRISDRFAVSSIKRQFPGSESRSAELARYYKVSFDAGTLDEAMQAYGSHPMVEKVEPIGIHAMYATPSDFYYSYQWHLNQASDHDIDAPEAWDIEAGADATIVAILDSGTRYYHPDLGGVNASPSNPGASRGNMWINTTELNGSGGVDDDGNGYVDDWIGYDFIQSTTSCWSGEDCGTKDNDPRDFNGHGTHTSGIFGMITNDGYGMCGVAGGWGNGTQTEYGNGVRIMALRMGYSYNYLGQEYGVVLMDAAAEAFYYAADNGAKIASCSWGSSNSGGIGSAATYFLSSGGIIVVAAGNDGAEVSPDYLNGRGDCISVAATDENDNGASFTTYGTWVDICAPGNNIYSTYHDHYDPNTNYWASMGGTSMATPMTAGVAALIWSRHASWTASQVRSQLYSSADNIDAYLSSKYIGKMGAGRINAFNAVNDGGVPPVANFSGTPTSGCVPLTVSFTDLSSNDPTSWSWDFGDLGTSSAQNPNHTYTSVGTYTVTLTATNAYGSDEEVKTAYITVIDVPTAGFTGSPRSGEVPLAVNFTNTSSGAASYLWDFGDTGGSTQTNPSHTYTEAGTYTVVLTATNACGSDIHTEPNYITVTCTPPVAGFVGSPTSGEVPLTVDFTDQSTGATSWSWDFGDTQSSTQQNPTHEYTDAGSYTVTLTATNSCGSDQEIKVDYITATCTPPIASFSGSPTSGVAPLTVNFTDLSAGAASWSWNFGDGVGTSTGQNPTYEYTSVGTYTVSLTVTNSCGSDGETKTDYITVTQGDVWTVITYDDFETGWGNYTDGGGDCSRYTGGTYAHQGNAAADIQDNSGVASSFYHTVGHNVTGYAELEVEFWFIAVSMDNSREDFWLQYYDGSSWHTVETWARSIDFDNGVFYNPVVTISSSQYNFPTNAQLRFMCDASGNSDDVYIDEIEFRGSGGEPTPPTADFVGSPTSGDYPLIVDFTDQSTGNPTSWSWDFGDGVGMSTEQNPSYTYTAEGTYTVTLTATNAYGSDDEVKIGYIAVTAPPPPTADFVGSPTSGVAPLTVNFTDQSAGNPTSWSWDFGDGVGTSTAQNPSYVYNDAGTYTVTLTATNAYGSDFETKTDYISVTEGGEWVVITYDDFESGMGNYTDGGGDMSLYTRGTYAHQGSRAADIQDNSGTASSFYHTAGYNVSGYTELEVEFWFYAVSMESGEDFWVQYYDGSSWRTVAIFARGTDFNNNIFYNPVVTISSSQYNFPTNAQLRFMCDASGNTDDVYIDEIEFRGMSGTSSFAKANSSIPEKFALSQNYPNPFNPLTRFTLDLTEQAEVSVVVYNITGQKVKTLMNEVMSAGTHTLVWDGTNDSGQPLSSGVYFYRAVAGDEMVTRKMTLLK